jgi:hypothetical protein
MSIVGAGTNRPKGDFYPTPPSATEALLQVEEFKGAIWEPACGDGAMSRVLEAAGYSVSSSDLYDWGYGQTGKDFLGVIDRVDNIVTNPPYKLALPFVKHALDCARYKVALLLKLVFLEGVGRRSFFECSPPARIWVFSKRLTIRKEGLESKNSGMIAYAWFIWEIGYTDPPIVGWI